MSDDIKVPPPVLIKRSEAKKGSLWHAAAQKRFFKQHGGIDVENLPENDAHALMKIQNPAYTPPASTEERKDAENSLERKINELKNQSPLATQNPVPSEPKGQSFYDEWTD